MVKTVKNIEKGRMEVTIQGSLKQCAEEACGSLDALARLFDSEDQIVSFLYLVSVWLSKALDKYGVDYDDLDELNEMYEDEEEQEKACQDKKLMLLAQCSSVEEIENILGVALPLEAKIQIQKILDNKNDDLKHRYDD